MNRIVVAGTAIVTALAVVVVAPLFTDGATPVDETFTLACSRTGDQVDCHGVVDTTTTSSTSTTTTTEVPTSTSTSTSTTTSTISSTSTSSSTTSTSTTTSTSVPPTTTTTVAPTTTTTVPPSSAVPPLSSVGPRVTLTNSGATSLAPGSYSGQKFGAVTLNACGTYVFTDVELTFNGALYPCRTVTLDHVYVNGGMWFEDSGGVGGQTGWTIKWSKLNGGTMQAMRPKGAGTVKVSDSWLFTAGTPIGTGVHTESVQHMTGANGTYDRVAFSVEPRWNGSSTPITAVMTFENGNDGTGSVFTDCTFGYWNGAWVAGGGFYAIYPGQATYVRPRIYHGGSGYWYNNTPPAGAKLVAPVYL